MIVSAQYSNKENTMIKASCDDGSVMFVPIAPGNMDYDFIINNNIAIAEWALAENLASSKEMKVSAIKSKAAALITASGLDWMVIREVSGGTPVPQSVKDYAATVRTTSNTKEAEVNALTTIRAVSLYDETTGW